MDRRPRWHAGSRTAAGYASSVMPRSSAGTGSSAGRGSGAAPGLSSPAEAAGAACPVPGGLAVHRSVHDLASLQYQRMSAQAYPPSGTIMPIGSAMPHSEHWADCGWRRRSLRRLAIDAPRPRQMLVHRKSASSSAAPAGSTAVADEVYAAMGSSARTGINNALGVVHAPLLQGNHSGPDNSGKPVRFLAPPGKPRKCPRGDGHR